MKRFKLKLILTIMMALGLATISLPGCAAEISGNSHWFVDENGHFHTNDVKLAQKKIPFTIVVPDYLPGLLGTDYQYEIIGPFKNILPNNIEVEIQYWDDRHQIYISEYSIKEIMRPNQEFQPIYYTIAGVQVLRQTAGFITCSGALKGLGYYWNKDNLTFEMEIFNIPEEEAIKIVESMIKQMKQ